MKVMKIVAAVILCACLAAGLAAIGINFYVMGRASKYILSPDSPGEDYDCVLVLGCGVRSGVPSPLLEDRLLRSVELYENGVSKKLLMSGDHGQENYDEVNVMKSFAVERGVPSEAVFMDHAGFSTYESMYRAKEIFKAEKVLIVTQKYHLYRAVYVARQLGLDACGVEAMPREYVGQPWYSFREILARDKDFFYAVFKPLPTYLGEEIPITGSGDITNDK